MPASSCSHGVRAAGRTRIKAGGKQPGLLLLGTHLALSVELSVEAHSCTYGWSNTESWISPEWWREPAQDKTSTEWT